MTALLPFLFGTVAFLYAMAGFGGGSTYTALLAISGLPLAAIPILSLTCNCLVTSQGSYLLICKGLVNGRIMAPLFATSMPCAFIGGAWRLPEASFIIILATALTLAGGGILWQNTRKTLPETALRPPSIAQLVIVGALLGLLAGFTGIGGGIYLAPVMHLLRWSTAKQITVCTSLFIMLNSLTGLIGQMSKGNEAIASVSLWLLIGCPVMVLIGGRLGSLELTQKISNTRIRLLTAIVILLVATRLWISVITENLIARP